MNPGDGVVQNSDGSWTATVNGQQVYNGPDNQQAQNAFISGQGNGNNQTIIGGQGYDPSQPTAPSEGFDAAYYAAAQAAMDSSIKAAYDQELANTGSNKLALDAAQQRAQDLIQYTRDNGDLALRAFSQVATTGVDIANLLTKMQGPSNAFAYDRTMQYLGNSGLGGALGAVTGAARPAQFGLMGPTQAMSFDTLNQGLGNTQGGPSIIDSLLGLGNQAWTQYGNATNNQLPFSLPQFSYNQNPQQGPSTPPAPTPTSQNQQQQQQTQQTQNTQQQQTQQTQQNQGLGIGDTSNPFGTQQNQQNQQQQMQQPGTIGDLTQTTLKSGPSYAAPTTNTTNAPTTDTGPGFSIPSNTPSTPTNPPPYQGTTGWGSINGNDILTPAQWQYPGYSATGAQYLSTLPDPSQMNAVNFFQLPKYSQDLMLSGYAAKGYDPNQLTDMWTGMLPGKAAGPAFGLSS